MRIVIIGENDVNQLHDALKTPYSFLRFHSPHCGHCVSMQDEMNHLMNNDEKLQNIDNLSIIDAHTAVASKSDHPVCKKHDGRVPAMFFIMEGKEPIEYQGQRTSKAMSEHILRQIEMNGGKKKRIKGAKRKTRKHKNKARKKKTHKRKPKRKRKTHKKFIAFKRNVKCPKGYVKGVQAGRFKKHTTLCKKKNMAEVNFVFKLKRRRARKTERKRRNN